MLSTRMSVLALDPDLGSGLDERAFRLAEMRCTAPLRSVRRARTWSGLDALDSSSQLGLLVVRGVLLYRLRLAGRETVDLVGCGDVIRPWQPLEEFPEMFVSSRWQVLEPAEVLILDLRFLEEAAPWPQLSLALAERMAWHARSLVLRLAISQLPRLDSRLPLMLWHLAERFGQVDRNGTFIPIRLTREMLAELVSACRESVSRQLKEFAGDGSIVQEPSGWRLCGAPPTGLMGDRPVASTETTLEPALRA